MTQKGHIYDLMVSVNGESRHSLARTFVLDISTAETKVAASSEDFVGKFPKSCDI